MLHLSQYELEDKIYESTSTLVYRGHSVKKKQPVIIKILNDVSCTSVKYTKLKWEFELLQKLKLKSIVKPIALIREKNIVALIEEDFGGKSLKEIMSQGPISVEKVLKYSIKICRALKQIHHKNIIHKNINPDNIIINVQTQEVKLIDFSIASMQDNEVDIKNINKIEGTLAYISPEQTGRMNRVVDYRTDFYSLGITMYEMLTSRLPYEANDHLELVHAHLAKEPDLKYLHDHHVPNVLSDIILKLLSKSADDRYQNASGIEADLELCLAQLTSDGKIEAFALGLNDIAEGLIIPQKFYGRETEIECLKKCFYKMMQGKSQFMTITGHSGVGKTSLIQEIYKPMTEKNGYFIHGKFVQYMRATPYSAFTQAFTLLIKNLLSENEEAIKKWRRSIIDTLQDKIQIMINVIPDLKLLLTNQDYTLSNIEHSEEDLHNTFADFIKLFSQKEHPLIIFLDDLQWIDSASLSLLSTLIHNKDIKYFYFIGAYRIEEVGDLHPLKKMFENLSEEGVTIQFIELSPLKSTSICDLLSDTFHQSRSEVNSLAKLVMKKTLGNPFFVIQFLKTLYQEGWLKFSLKDNKWKWELTRINNENITDNVVVLMMQKLKKLSPKTQKLLTIAACIGNRFSLKTLSGVYKNTLKTSYEIIGPAVKDGLIVQQSKPILTSPDMEGAIVVEEFKFLHDRVQQAAYQAEPEDVRILYHAKIGELLLSVTPETEIDNKLFEIVDHLNLAAKVLEPKLIANLLDLNIRATLKAKQAFAYESALWYLKHAMQTFTKDAWVNNYDKVLQCYKQRIELEYLNRNFSEAEKYFYESLPHINNPIDKSHLYIAMMKIMDTKEKLPYGVKLGIEALELLNINLPPDGQLHEESLLGMDQLEKTLIEKTPEYLLHMPPISNERIETGLAILNELIMPSSSVNHDLRLFVQLTMMKLSMEYGRGKYLVRALGSFVSNYHRLKKENYAFTSELLKIVLKLAELENDAYQKANALHIYARNIVWSKPINSIYKAFELSIEVGMSSGNYTYAGGSMAYISAYKMAQSSIIKNIIEVIKSYYNFSKGHIVSSAEMLEKILFAIEVMQGKKSANDLIKNQAQMNMGRNWLTLFKAEYFIFLDDTNKALEYIQKSKCLYQLNDFHENDFMYAEHLFFYALIHLRSWDKLTEKQNYQIEIEAILSQFEIWVKSCPDNFQAMYLILKAELARINHAEIDAVNFYNDAYTSARNFEFRQYAALASELQAKFWLQFKNEDLGSMLLKQALKLYDEWGFVVKVKQLKKTYNHLFIHKYFDRAQDSITDQELANIDLNALNNINLSLAANVSTTDLLNDLLQIISKIINTDHAVLLLKTDNRLYIEGLYNLPNGNDYYGVEVTKSNDLIPLHLVTHVYQDKQPIVLNNVTIESVIYNDAYFTNKKPRSLLCFPLIKYNDVVGILYFESVTETKYFDEYTLNKLNIIAQPATITIENIKLYKSVECFVPHELLLNLNKENIIDVKPGDYIQKFMTVLVTDIRNFSGIAERYDPQHTFDLVNKHIAVINPVIRSHRGFVIKYIGDSIVAIFPESPDDALKASIGIQEAITSLNAQEDEQLKLGIGIHSGSMMIGTVGDEDHMDATVITNILGITQLVESATKNYKTSIIITNHVKTSLQDNNFKFRFLGNLQSKGYLYDIQLYELLLENHYLMVKDYDTP